MRQLILTLLILVVAVASWAATATITSVSPDDDYHGSVADGDTLIFQFTGEVNNLSVQAASDTATVLWYDKGDTIIARYEIPPSSTMSWEQLKLWGVGISAEGGASIMTVLWNQDQAKQ